MYVKAVEKSENRKTGSIAVTMVTQRSCPAHCPFLHNGCYAEHGPQGWLTRKLNPGVRIPTPVEIAVAEARAIDRLSGRRPLRLHVVGDCATDEAARIVSAAAARYQNRGGQCVWTYTHAWRDVARESWGRISVLASCENVGQVAQAFAREYATVLVVPEYAATTPYDVEGKTIIPCPEMTGKALNCTQCQLCWRDRVLRAKRLTVGFSVHGRKAEQLKYLLIRQGGARNGNGQY